MAKDKEPESIFASLYRQSTEFALGEHPLSKYGSPVFLLADALLTSLVIYRVSYTEIDWKAYMEQVQQYGEGERDYTKIKGGTGPLVYPAAHVYIYWILYHVTNKGRDIILAQRIFGVLYLATIAVVMACYRRAKAPLYIFPMLVLSKRLHSIFVLRLFNDCFAVFFLWVAIYAFQRRLWTLGSLAYSWGLGIKMSLLLALPAMGVMLLLGRGLRGGLKQAWLMAQVQIILAFPFMPANAMGYLGRAFEFSRQFLFKWTVNWRFVGEEIFLSKEFSTALLVGHISALVVFITSRWLRPAEITIMEMVYNVMKLEEPFGKMQDAVSTRVSPNYILTSILSANAIGMLFARSLHYQFYAYIALATPFLLWRSGLHPILQYLLWATQEWAWNVYPSTNTSSMVAVGMLFAQVAGVWWGTRKDFYNPKDEGGVQKTASP
ncbi:glycosyltransferase family 58 protein [Amylocarpus encephaloides]|uniref:Dol-P-Man:Man(5)GlcNAc(2)-PP-Dol alpha-1,3-mannosyltransferase n=1 Tax=Amylocarpus encephaloides TaxID=45428 RepID=A0A9P7YJI1_9HELO|nr:glycosyltransferase family 58 protein [Amylocarpus encephaloides]